MRQKRRPSEEFSAYVSGIPSRGGLNYPTAEAAATAVADGATGKKEWDLGVHPLPYVCYTLPVWKVETNPPSAMSSSAIDGKTGRPVCARFGRSSIA